MRPFQVTARRACLAAPLLLTTSTGCGWILGIDATVSLVTKEDGPSSDVGVDSPDADALLPDTSLDGDTLDAGSERDAASEALPDVSVEPEGGPAEADTFDADAAPMDQLSEDAIAEASRDDAPWSPRDLSGLALWLDPAGIESDTGSVTAWRDQSGHGNHATPYYAAKPAFVARAVGDYPGVQFSGGGEILTVKDHASLQFGTADFVIEIVMRHNTPLFGFPGCREAYGAVLVKAESLRPFRGPALWANFPATFPVGPVFPVLAGQIDNGNAVSTDPALPGAFNDDLPRLVTLYRSVDHLSIRVNGAPKSTIPTLFDAAEPPSISAVGFDLFIGGQRERVQCFRGVITEIVAASPVTIEETIELDNYLLRKHASALQATEDAAP